MIAGRKKTDEVETRQWLEDNWLVILRPLSGEPGAIETAERIWDGLIKLIYSGEIGRQMAVGALRDAIAICRNFTDDQELAFEGKVQPDDSWPPRPI